MNSATHVYIRPQNINNKSMSETELDPISPQISTLALIFLCFFLSCYPHFHLVSFLSCFFFSIPCFLLLFFLLPFYLLLFFRGKIVTFFPVSLSPSRLLPFFFLLLFFLLLFFLPKTVTFFPVTFFPVTFFPSTGEDTLFPFGRQRPEGLKIVTITVSYPPWHKQNYYHCWINKWFQGLGWNYPDILHFSLILLIGIFRSFMIIHWDKCHRTLLINLTISPHCFR